MLVEIPDLDVILSVILAFLGGLGALYLFYKARPHIRSGSKTSAMPDERLEYYERQLIDMKIRLDAMEIQGVEQKTDDSVGLKELLGRLAADRVQEAAPETPRIVPEKAERAPRVQVASHLNPTDHVLHLITDKAMTSRDIQVTLGKSREHISRLMKRLFEEGFVERNTVTKPYTYSITKKGRARAGDRQVDPIAA
ncbi:MAG: MarR family transcriptional regulator [Nitrosopumilus sp. H13]|nr:MAG: MarR family transcriptional regulator [Nitrosopumilus sp. H13]